MATMKNRCIIEQMSMHLKVIFFRTGPSTQTREVGVGIEGGGKLWIKKDIRNPTTKTTPLENTKVLRNILASFTLNNMGEVT